MINKYCENCGKLLNKHTLICDACGTDYNEKPECEHLYDKYMIVPHEMDQTIWLHLRCSKCNEVTALICSRGMIADLVTNGSVFHR